MSFYILQTGFNDNDEIVIAVGFCMSRKAQYAEPDRIVGDIENHGPRNMIIKRTTRKPLLPIFCLNVRQFTFELLWP